MTATFSYTAIIACHNASRTLDAALSSLETLQPRPDAILVVDDASTDDTAEIVRAHSEVHLVGLRENRGAAGARNEGARLVQTPWLLMVDADCYVGCEGFAQAVELLRSEPDLDGVMGVFEPDAPSGPWAGRYKNFYRHCEICSMDNPPHIFTSSCFLIRTAAYQAIGGFDDAFGRIPTEDNEFYFRLIQAGYRMKYVREFSFVHDKPMGVFRLFREDAERAEAIVQNLRGRLGATRQGFARGERLRALVELASGLGTLAGPPALLVGLCVGGAVAATFAAVFLIASLVFCLMNAKILGRSFRLHGFLFTVGVVWYRAVEMSAAVLGIARAMFGSPPRKGALPQRGVMGSLLHGADDYLRTCLRVVNKRGGPLHLVFFITNRCDFHCQHCFLIPAGELNNKLRPLLTLDEIERVARSVPQLIALSLTGGEPFLRKDYADIVRLFLRHTRLKTLSTVSNGIDADRVLPHIEPILRESPVSFFLSISVDGNEATHNRVRQKENAFARTLESIRQLRRLKETYPQFSLGVNSTYLGTNFEDLMALYDELEVLQPHYLTLNLLRGQDWTDRQQGLATDEYRRLSERKNEVMRRSNTSRTLTQKAVGAKDRVMTDLLARTYDENRSLFPCYGGQLLAVLKDNGDVFPCEQLAQRFGNIRDYDGDLMKVWESEVAKQQRQFIVDRKCHCTYECVMSANILFNPRMVPRLLSEMIRGG